MQELKIGMIGLDSSHCQWFAETFNIPDSENYIPGIKIIKAVPVGTKEVVCSWTRVEKFTQVLADAGAEIVNSISELGDLDAYIITSVLGAQHLEQFKELVKFKKPVFIDKPLANSYSDACEIAEIAKKHNIPLMTFSDNRFDPEVLKLKEAVDDPVSTCESFGSVSYMPGYRDYFWYGIHTVETLFAFMGCGIESVQTIEAGDTTILIGRWSDGRSGIARCYQKINGFGCNVNFGKKLQSCVLSYDTSYAMETIISFLRTGVSCVTMEESLDIMAFLEAASRSREAGGEIINTKTFRRI